MAKHAELLHRTRTVLGVTQNGLGEMIGVSRRTAQRMGVGQSIPSGEQLAALAALIHRHDEDLAAELAAAGGTSLERLGLVAPPAPVAAPAVALVIDSVVCAAAEAMDVLPRAVRPALLAAVRRARQLGLTLESMDRALCDSSADGHASE